MHTYLYIQTNYFTCCSSEIEYRKKSYKFSLSYHTYVHRQERERSVYIDFFLMFYNLLFHFKIISVVFRLGKQLGSKILVDWDREWYLCLFSFKTIAFLICIVFLHSFWKYHFLSHSPWQCLTHHRLSRSIYWL